MIRIVCITKLCKIVVLVGLRPMALAGLEFCDKVPLNRTPPEVAARMKEMAKNKDKCPSNDDWRKLLESNNLLDADEAGC